jgi:long-chain acyl-CoA synthetase
MSASLDDPTLAEQCAKAAADLTIPVLLHRNSVQFADLPALSVIGSPDPVLTWGEVRNRVAALARGLAELGLRSGDRMLILASSRTEHWLVDVAAVHLGAVPCTAYATLSTEQLRFLGQHSQARVIVVEGAEQLARLQPVLDELPAVVRVVVMEEAALPGGDERFVSFRAVEEAGAELHRADPSVFEETWPKVRPEQPLTLLYTSGTTGDPKGVILTHYNVLYQATALEALTTVPEHAPSVAYLPLAHIAERVLGIYVPIFRAAHVHLVGDPRQILAALTQVRPTSFFGVPRIWEKMVAGLQGYLGAADENVKAAFTAASDVALAAYDHRAHGEPVPADLAARLVEADRTVLRPIRSTLGLDDIISAGSGAAPIPVAVLLFLAGLGVDVFEVWGMTETTGSATINTPDSFRTGTVGRASVGVELRIADDGEILVRGPQVFLGYLQADGSVLSGTDAEGWLATGDVGTLDEDGFLTITDRKKELIITASGKNISPAQIENALRSHPLIGYAVAVGDRRPYVTALIALDEESAPVWARAHGLEEVEPDALAEHPTVLAEIQTAVDAANERLSRPEQVKKFRILPRTWTPESGELTPTMKLRRRVIADRYAPDIDDLYA